jgi:hypothetical protein
MCSKVLLDQELLFGGGLELNILLISEEVGTVADP